MTKNILILIFSCFLVTTAQAASDRYAANSVLAEGNWVKIQVDSTGIYKLTHADLKDMGFSDPSKVTIYGYGGWPLEEDFSKKNAYTDDLPQVPVWREDSYILFYAKGTVKWEYKQFTGRVTEFVHTPNPYSNHGYYFVTDSRSVEEMTVEPSISSQAMQQINVFDDYLLHENDLVSVNASGRKLYGESFEATTSRSFTKYISGITNDKGKATMEFIARHNDNSYSSATLQIGNQKILEGYISAAGNSSYTKAVNSITSEDWTGDKSEEVKVTISYSRSGHQNVHLDYFRLQMKRELRPYNAFTFFRSIASINNISRFTISDTDANTMIWDVTDGASVKLVETESNGSNLSFTIPAAELREFVIVQKNKSFPKPTILKGFIKNQDLHSYEERDMVIIAPTLFHEQAERLAEEHRQRDGLSVCVVDPKQIYNEFSSGAPDATAYRRFMKMFYDRSQSGMHEPPKYLLLFGDGLYDNRGRAGDNVSGIYNQYKDQLLLTYQSSNSLDVYSYVTDDYFGFLDDNSGGDLRSAKLRLGIGRLPVRSLTEATQAVNKLIGYMDNTVTGPWKNKLAFVADDGSNSDDFTNAHMKDANDLAKLALAANPGYIANKVFLDAYKKDFSGGQTRFPEAATKIQQLLKNGLFMINYSGHGNTSAWADEKILTSNDISRFTHASLPLWVTATCDFTRFDDAATSAGESIFLHKTSGGIALFTTTRPVYQYMNFELNKRLTDVLFTKKDGKYPTLGDVIRDTKVDMGADDNKLKFLLIGDPAMRLNYPEYGTRITSINGKPISDEPITFRALDRITVEGEVLDPSGQKASDFTGLINPTVLDSKVEVTCLVNSNNSSNDRTPFQYEDNLNVLYVGNDEVKGGTFSFTFTVPKDISYSNDYGIMNLYAVNESAGIEAQGAFTNFKVGGTSEEIVDDKEGPEIRAIYMNDSTFIDGAKVNTTPLFVARVWDESGINITGSGIGHDMTLIIDSTSSKTYILNSYYQTIPDGAGEGVVTFQIPTLEAGIHTADFIVWDVQNNMSSRRITFEVVEGLKPVLSEIVATPNPARDIVEFYLNHNRPEAYLNVNIMVYDMTGRLQWSHEEHGSSDLFKSYIVSWDLNNNNGARLRPGVYFYRAAISTNNSKEATKSNKLIILAQ